MRKFLIALLVLLGVMFVIGHLAEVQTIVDTLRRGDWLFVLFAFSVQLIWILNVAAMYWGITFWGADYFWRLSVAPAGTQLKNRPRNLDQGGNQE
jgi:hypothetical protein